ncbi:LytTR family transcriptional regulator [Chitinophaga horti]|uniref:LytTR family transcriptional regulator n=1 Tax=Chitinophaga horti TaxID=2920382 RepID=A0ABY6J5G6_9BACT|nr:LytTR family DNA-binding domain-containing protein [Chitinophaga horti]UYQ94925.1 LytTR family transcriptional regulator [Chitinophaga horti]
MKHQLKSIHAVPPLEAIKIAHLPAPVFYLQRVLVDNGKRLVNLAIDAIIYLKADREYTWIHTADRTYLTAHGISYIEKKLDPALFIRIHRSYIVNLQHVKEIRRDHTRLVVTLPNNVEVAVSRNYMPALKQLIL